MIYRTILVKDDTKLADLHRYLQIIMGWEGIHLHQFLIRGTNFEHGDEVCLKDFQFHANEKFIYEYDFSVPWEHEIRVEKKLDIETDKTYPVCMSGKGSAPPEDCGSPAKFMELRDHYASQSILFETMRTLGEYEEGECEEEDIEDMLDDFTEWQERPKFNRRIINQYLHKSEGTVSEGGYYED